MSNCQSCSDRQFHNGGKTAVTKLVAWSLDQARSIVSRPQRMAASGGNQRTFVSGVCLSVAVCRRLLVLKWLTVYWRTLLSALRWTPVYTLSGSLVDVINCHQAKVHVLQIGINKALLNQLFVNADDSRLWAAWSMTCLVTKFEGRLQSLYSLVKAKAKEFHAVLKDTSRPRTNVPVSRQWEKQGNNRDCN